MDRYTAVESIRYVHKASGRTYSPFGACPWTGAAGDTAADYERRIVGWTVRNNREGTVGIGREPWKTQAEAQAWADEANAKDRAWRAECARRERMTAETRRLTSPE